jgi:O-antigen/teichoic acid export membrane protein
MAFMGLVIAVQWPSSLYDGGLTGLQRQVLLNVIRATSATVQHAGAVLVLWFVSPTIVAYFAWQIAVAVVQTAALRLALWRVLPPSEEPSVVRSAILRRHWHFAAGMTGISILGIILTQADKIVLSKYLTMEAFGYYALAANLAGALLFMVAPIFSAVFPRLTQLFSAADGTEELRALYHRTCQGVSALVLPAASILIVFPHEVLLLWTRDQAVAAHSAPLLRVLAIGTSLNALMFAPFLAQISSGWTRLSLLKNVVAVAIVIPLMLWMVSAFGAMGGALSWLLLNLGYVVFEIPLMHRRILPGEMGRWYRTDLALPVGIVALVSGASRLLMPRLSQPLTAAWIVATAGLALAVTSAVLPATRTWVRNVSAA